MMKKKQYRYYKLIEKGNVKYVKTNDEKCQVILFESGKPKKEDFPYPYPIWEYSEQPEITNQEYMKILKSIPNEQINN